MVFFQPEKKHELAVVAKTRQAGVPDLPCFFMLIGENSITLWRDRRKTL